MISYFNLSFHSRTTATRYLSIIKARPVARSPARNQLSNNTYSIELFNGAEATNVAAFRSSPTSVGNETYRSIDSGSAMQTTHSSRQHVVLDTIALTQEELELLNTLRAAAEHANSGTVLRCAGGWVRDKLLGRESKDIDVAVDNMLGKDFAELVNQFLKSQGKESRNAAVIQSNPDQSKHLETARMKINDLWIDLVNLRSETYASDSRIPTMQFGTPVQDALRRDFTINSMFYNINTNEVEDLTGRGRSDLKDGILRTPLAPLETFLDDPLRVMRAVRFATRFGFELEMSLEEAASSEKVKEALGQKISKERIGTELEGMFNGPAPVAAVRLLDQLGLFLSVFALPPEQVNQLTVPASSSSSSSSMTFGCACGDCMEAAAAVASALGIVMDQEEKRFLQLAALVLPLRGMQVPGAKGKPTPATTYIIRESIKWRAKDADMTLQLHETAVEFLGVYTQLLSSSSASSRGMDTELDSTAAGSGAADGVDCVKIALGLAIRKLKQHWKLGVVLSQVLAMPCARPFNPEVADYSSILPSVHPSINTCGSTGSSTAAMVPTHPAVTNNTITDRHDIVESNLVSRGVEAGRLIMSAASAFGLEECWQWKPLLDGKQVMPILGLQKPGPELGPALAAVIEWQLTHPVGTADECKEFLVKHWAPSKQ